MVVLWSSATRVIVSPIPGAQREYFCPMETLPSTKTVKILKSVGIWNWNRESAGEARRLARQALQRERGLEVV